MLEKSSLADDATGRVEALFFKTDRSLPMTRLVEGAMPLRAGFGIEGDVNANPMSPRQVLLTRAEDLQYFNIAPGALRENIVVAGLAADLFIPGAELAIGNDVQVRLTLYCEPCKRIGHLISSYRAIFERRGVLGVVLSGGTVRESDAVRSRPGAFPSLPFLPFARFLQFVARIPASRVVTYRDVTVGMGVAEGFARAIPGYIRRADSGYPVHRILDSHGALIGHVQNQRARLESEGVQVQHAASLFVGESAEEAPLFYVDVARYAWSDETIFMLP